MSMEHKILIVDDEAANLRLLARLFRREYQVLTAESGAEALDIMQQHDVALLITDQRMPQMTGIELLSHAARLRPHTVRIILTGYTDTQALVEAINCGQVYRFVTKPWDNDDLRNTVARALQHYEDSRARFELARTNERLARNLQDMTHAFVRAIGDALDAKDDYAHGHARRTEGYALAIGRRMNLDEETLQQLSLAAFLHDIGRIGTPDALLLKPGALTDEERRIMQQHSERGARILAGVPGMNDITSAVRHHHEHFDGTGYPEGLRGFQIPTLSRIILVADAYDALTCPRPFRAARTHTEAVAILRADAGTSFDPEIVRAFCELEHLSAIRGRIAEADFGLHFVKRADDDFKNATLEELQTKVCINPVLALHVLREANERDSTSVADLKQACVKLGTDRLQLLFETLANQSSTASHEAPFSGTFNFPELERFQEVSLRCAVAAQLLAERTDTIAPTTAYTLGLTHDTGRALLNAAFPDEMRELVYMEEAARMEAEVARFGVDHAQIGEWIALRCGLSRVDASVIASHHDVLRTGNLPALLLHVAACLAHAKSTHTVAALDALGSDRLALLGLNRAQLVNIYERTAAIVEDRLMAEVLGANHS